MPELIEIEFYRQAAATTVGRRIATVTAPDAWYLKGGLDARALAEVTTGAVIEAARRHGKVLLLDLADRPTLGLRFGMTGRLVVDGGSIIEQLEYSSNRQDPAWDRVGFTFDDGGEMHISDPRRLGGVELDPDLSRLGPDASTITPAALRRSIDGPVALKARLLDQSRIAGIGNLIADDTLWRASLSPRRAGSSLDDRELRRLSSSIRASITELTSAGGSHTGALQALRAGGAPCPRCGGLLDRITVGGRTTLWCPAHQR